MACSSCGSPLALLLAGSPTASPGTAGSSCSRPFRKQRNNERTEIDRARKAAEDCAERNP